MINAMHAPPEIDLPHLGSGKVRETYQANKDHLLMVTTDRISAYDVVMDEPIPNKGRVLSGMAAFWPADQWEPGKPSQALTNSICGIGWTQSAGTITRHRQRYLTW